MHAPDRNAASLAIRGLLVMDSNGINNFSIKLHFASIGKFSKPYVAFYVPETMRLQYVFIC